LAAPVLKWPRDRRKDYLHQQLTVEEALGYAAELRLPRANDEKRRRAVDKVLARGDATLYSSLMSAFNASPCSDEPMMASHSATGSTSSRRDRVPAARPYLW
jgi:hypothetical protein